MQVQELSNTSLALEHQEEVESQTQRGHAQGEGDNLQSIKHKTQIMKEKYFCILAYISMRLITVVCLTDKSCVLAGPSTGELINLV